MDKRIVIEVAGGIVTGVSIDGEYHEDYFILDYDDAADDITQLRQLIAEVRKMPEGPATTTMLDALHSFDEED